MKDTEPNEDPGWLMWIIFIPPGQIPQRKARCTDDNEIATMLAEMKAHYPPETVFMVATLWNAGELRLTDLSVDSAEDWLLTREAMTEYEEYRADYIRKGVCSQCGACSLQEAATKCCPSPLGDTGDYSCDGEGLWEDEREAKEREED